MDQVLDRISHYKCQTTIHLLCLFIVFSNVVT